MLIIILNKIQPIHVGLVKYVHCQQNNLHIQVSFIREVHISSTEDNKIDRSNFCVLKKYKTVLLEHR